MKAAVFVKPGRVEVREVPKPKIDGENQAIIRIIRASVCGSDGGLEAFLNARKTVLSVMKPLVW